MNGFGTTIRQLRKAHGLTMKQLGQLLNLAESTISGYENDNRRPDIDTLVCFAQLFGVTVDFLLGFSSRSPSNFSEGTLDVVSKMLFSTAHHLTDDASDPLRYELHDAHAVTQEETIPYQINYPNGKVDTLSPDEAIHVRTCLEMFRRWKSRKKY